MIKKQLVNGTIKPGDKLLSTRELAIAYTINPNTSMRVYSELEAEGIAYTKRGLGTFVSEDHNLVENLKKEMANSLTQYFLNEFKNLGYTKEELIDIINRNF